MNHKEPYKWILLKSEGKLVTPLTNKEIRYAMIKGKNEKKHPELKPWYCQPDPSMVNIIYEFN